jgi:hypothetical protein
VRPSSPFVFCPRTHNSYAFFVGGH